MAFNAKILLDKRRSKDDNSFPVILRLLINRKSTSISLNLSLPEKAWDDKNQCIKSGYKGIENVSRLNNSIFKKRTHAMDVLLKLDETGKLDTLSIKEIKSIILGQKEKTSFFSFGERLIKEMLMEGKVGNARVYKETLNWVKKYGSKKDLPFEHITFAWLKKVENKYLSKGNSVNGLSVRLRTVRGIYNRAIKEKVIDRSNYPFDDYSIKQAPTKKRAITNDDLQKIVGADLTDKQMIRAREFFMISYYLMGASFIDMAYLQLSDYVNGRIRYKRKKNGRLYNIKVSKQLTILLAPYLVGKSKDDYLLPIINQEHPTKEKEYYAVRYSMRQYNKDLKKLAIHLGIEEKSFSSYTSRHTFATNARDNDVSLQVISKMMGHRDLKTTQVYLANIKDEAVDDALDQMFGAS